ncbi:partial Cell division protein FtsA, partial [Patescibacteria group bacterium]
KANIEQSGNEYRLPAGIVITGGSAMVPEITSIAKKSFGVPARIGTPKGLDGLVDGISSPAYAAAQGLVLYALGDEVYRGDSRYTGGSSGKKKSSSQGGFIGKLGGIFKNILP